jgi:hypothetical protein
VGISLISLVFAWLLIPLGAHADASGTASKENLQCVGNDISLTAWANPDAGTLVVVEGNKNGKRGVVAVAPASTTDGTGEFLTFFKTTVAALVTPDQRNTDPDASKEVTCARYKGGPFAEDAQGFIHYEPDNACILLTCRPVHFVTQQGVRRPSFPELTVNVCNTADNQRKLCPPPPKPDPDGQ